MIRLRLLSRPGCHLCNQMQTEIDSILGDRPHQWEVVNVDCDPDLARRYNHSIPVLFVNERLFAKIRLPRLALRLRLLRAAELRD